MNSEQTYSVRIYTGYMYSGRDVMVMRIILIHTMRRVVRRVMGLLTTVVTRRVIRMLIIAIQGRGWGQKGRGSEVWGEPSLSQFAQISDKSDSYGSHKVRTSER